MFQLNKRVISLALVATLGLSFTACGGSDSGSSDSSAGGSSSSGSSSFTPIVPFSCEVTMTSKGAPDIEKMGTSGNIVCSKQSDGDMNYIQTSFADGVNEMVIAQAILEDNFKFDSSYGTATTDLKKGTEHIVGSDGKHDPVDCVNTYDVPLPITISDPEQITDFDIESYQLKSTTCPDWVNEDDDSDEDIRTGTYQSNLTITETSGSVTKISTSYTTK